MTALFAGGRIIDFILAGMVLEGLVLGWRGFAPRAFVPNLLSGMSVLLAMRLVLGGAWWGFASAALLCGLVFHVLDLSGRLR